MSEDLTVLVVDDDAAIRRTLQINLRARGYRVEPVADGRSALQAAAEQVPDVVLLDLGLPDLDGVEVLRRLREFTRVPVIVVSARIEPDDKVEALDGGADDYLTKPFSVDELMARIRVCTRRAASGPPALVVNWDDVQLDVTESRASRGDEQVHLTPLEWKLVEVLVSRRGRLVRQADLLQAVWGPGHAQQTNYLRVHLASIRRKLEADPAHPRHFVTEPGIGHRFLL